MRLLLLLTACVLFAPDVNAQFERVRGPGEMNATYRLTGPITTTNLSGANGQGSFLITPEGPNMILYGLTFAERSDNPCSFLAHFWSAPNGFVEGRLMDGERQHLPFSGSLPCEGTPRSRREIRAEFPPPTSFRGDNGAAAIHGIQVCSNDRNPNNYKLKGARIFVSALNRDGQGEIRRDPGLAESFERTNCREWEPAQRCPVGKVAVGVQVFYRNSSITGLALRCQAVEITSL